MCGFVENNQTMQHTHYTHLSYVEMLHDYSYVEMVYIDYPYTDWMYGLIYTATAC